MQPNPIPALPDLPDAELARRVAAGERDAFTLLMRRYNRSLYRAARSILRDDAEAEDALQDAYLLALAAIGQYRAEAKLGTWLTRIVVNAALAQARRGRRRAAVIQLDGSAEPGEEQDMRNGAHATPEDAALRTQMRQLLEQSIDQLPEAFRTVFMLRAVEEMSGEEVAACLDIPEATVRSRYFRARSLLRAALAQRVDVALEDAFGFDGARCDRIVAGVLARL
ncbi:RNA polymerase sigma factor [Duganella sp. FT3S]|uniref:RNA polymerase sigma factor n=2 Tax=Rugamonas fusca TaxID=2758568 RepID=A0A7W2EJJ3_9BURK|nr:RNA polymerase sigma factor [Rugamonas fusca]MBA5607076.1 RNA polymerase sigma factor [Rugamonas fusca]